MQIGVRRYVRTFKSNTCVYAWEVFDVSPLVCIHLSQKPTSCEPNVFPKIPRAYKDTCTSEMVRWDVRVHKKFIIIHWSFSCGCFEWNGPKPAPEESGADNPTTTQACGEPPALLTLPFVDHERGTTHLISFLWGQKIKIKSFDIHIVVVVPLKSCDTVGGEREL